MIELGIDESGRGSLLGPLVVGFAIIDENQKKLLEDKKITDSKLMTAKRRLFFWNYSRRIKCITGVRIASSKEVDNINLNFLETVIFSKIIQENYKENMKIIIDAFVQPEKLQELSAKLAYVSEIPGNAIVALNKAEIQSTAVALASIIARVEWDTEVKIIKKDIKEKFGINDIGNLYTPDHKTLRFVRDHKDYPEVRQSFHLTGKNWEKILNEPLDKR